MDQLYVLFSQDSNFRQATFDDQMGVLRGQVLNLRRALREHLTPADLVSLPTAKLYVQRGAGGSFNGTQKLADRLRRKYRQIMTNKGAFFKWC